MTEKVSVTNAPWSTLSTSTVGTTAMPSVGPTFKIKSNQSIN